MLESGSTLGEKPLELVGRDGDDSALSLEVVDARRDLLVVEAASQ